MTRSSRLHSNRTPAAQEGRSAMRRALCLLVGAAACLALGLPAAAASAADTAPKHFASPEEAVAALVAAARAADRAALLQLFGSDAKEIVDSGDPVADRNAVERFVASYDTHHQLTEEGDTQQWLEVGADDWPLPVPLVKDADGWFFDGEAGEDEIVSRRIGRNELAAIQACLAFVDAQREYYARDPDGAPLLHYARRFASSQGKRDGLYYPTQDGEKPSPLGPAFDAASAQGYSFKSGEPVPFHGYFFKILEGQGPKAPGGAYSYVVGDYMVGGYALVAYPAVYGVSGVMTFFVNHDGDVYQKNLGPQTAEKAKALTLFDLDADTERVPESDVASQPGLSGE